MKNRIKGRAVMRVATEVQYPPIREFYIFEGMLESEKDA